MKTSIIKKLLSPVFGKQPSIVINSLPCYLLVQNFFYDPVPAYVLREH